MNSALRRRGRAVAFAARYPCGVLRIDALTLIALGLAAAVGCGDDDDVVCGTPVPLTLMTYNVANQTGENGENIAAHITARAPDFVAAQECSECEWLVAKLPVRYRLTAPPRAGVAILYDADSWALENEGVFVLGDDDDGWGERVARWARFSNLETAHCLYVYSTHFCATARSPDDACDVDRQLDYADTVLTHIDSRVVIEAPVLLAGDLNVFDGFEDGAVIQEILASGLVDVFREAEPTADGTTFEGNDWAPAGRLDYVFATPPVEVSDAVIDRDAIAAGEGSDHYAVLATVEFVGSLAR